MKATLVRIALPVLCLATAAVLNGQQPTTPVYTQTLTYLKVPTGKGDEYLAFFNETSKKMAQVRANAGEILSYTLLRSVYPAGEEARANYLVSIIFEGAPQPPASRSKMETDLKKAGVKMSIDEFLKKRTSLATLVAQEMWRPQARVAAPKVGHYIFINQMKVLDAPNYFTFEQTVWRPLAEEWVKQGAMSGWIFATKMLPGGTDAPYTAYSADMFPSWQAVFAPRPSQPIFAKVHAGKNYDETMSQISKLRSLGRRELWVVVERVEKDGSGPATSRPTQE